MPSIASWQVKVLSLIGLAPVFICHRSRHCSDITGRICDGLARKLGHHRVIKDDRSIPLGVDYRDYIEQVVPYSRALLVVISPDWLAPGHSGSRPLDNPMDLVRLEVASAFRNRRRVIPVLVGGATIPLADALPEPLKPLSYRQGLAIRSDPDFSRDLERLIADL